MYSRLAMVTTPPGELQPRQSVCHRDRLDFAANQCIAASVLYLFKEPALGGTSFFVQSRPQPEIDKLVHDSSTLDADAFAARYALARDYMRDSNAFFNRALTVAARWNRLIFYDGSIFHSGDIAHPELLTDQPGTGRLTLNGFFTCSRGAAAAQGRPCPYERKRPCLDPGRGDGRAIALTAGSELVADAQQHVVAVILEPLGAHGIIVERRLERLVGQVCRLEQEAEVLEPAGLDRVADLEVHEARVTRS